MFFQVESNEDALESSDFILLDSNLSVPVMARVLEIAKKHDKQGMVTYIELTKTDKNIQGFSLARAHGH